MPNFSGIWTVTQQMQAKGASTWPAPPGAPTIGTATAGGTLCASVTFTAPSCTGYPTSITGYRVISTPGCLTATGASSPLVVTGLTNATSYTFKAQATNATGYGGLSAASNSITAAVVTCATYTTPGTYSWVAPAGVTSVAVLVVSPANSYKGGSLAYKNGYSVTPGSSYTVFLNTTSGGENVYSYFVSSGTVGATANAFTGDGGGLGGGAGGGLSNPGGSGAGGYSGNGGAGSTNTGSGANGGNGSGGGGGGGAAQYYAPSDRYLGGGGGGVGIYGQGASGTGGTFGSTFSNGGTGGSGGGDGSNGTTSNFQTTGGLYGGGRGPNDSGVGAQGGAVRIVWAGGSRGTPSFPSTNVGP